MSAPHPAVDASDDLETLTVESRGDGVLELRVDRPRRMNAIDEAMIGEFPRAVTPLADEPPEALVVSGSGSRAFSIGLDPDIFDALDEVDHPPSYVRETVTGPLSTTFAQLARLPTPIVAAVQGPAYGGGLELALTADIRLAGESAEGSQPEIEHGFIPAGGATQRLPALIGEARAKQILFTGDTFDAETLSEWGLYARLLDDDSVRDEALSLAASLAENPRTAYAGAKRAIATQANRDPSGLTIEREVAIEQLPDIKFSEMD